MSSAATKSGLEIKTKEQGCATTLVAALDPRLEGPDVYGNRAFLSDCQFGEAASWAKDPEAAKKLWALSESLVGQNFSW